jgi:hypothetical protein
MKIILAAQLMSEEGLRYEFVTDLPTLMKASKGKINPNNAVAIRPLIDGDVLLFDVYQVVDWIRAKGLQRC